MTGTAKIHPHGRVGWRRVIDSESLLLQGSTDVDEVIGDHGEPNPALHSGLASVARKPRGRRRFFPVKPRHMRWKRYHRLEQLVTRLEAEGRAAIVGYTMDMRYRLRGRAT
jgi:hypothetical protein